MNVNRPFNKLDSVKELIEKYSFDILALFETWLTSEISDSEISIMGYSIVRKTDRIRRKLAVVFLFMLETVSHLFAKLTLWKITLNVFGSKSTDGSASPWLSVSSVDQAI